MEKSEMLLIEWQHKQIEIAKSNEENIFLGIPDSWYEPRPLFACENGHLSKMYLKSEALGRNVCLQCMKNVYIIPNWVTQGELTEILTHLPM